jgi:hypothetical protein
MMRRTALAALAVLLAGCAATPPPEQSGPRERVLGGAGGTCMADAATPLIGQEATQALGQRALDLTGARLFRWAPPDSALTMDYRPDRVTVHYDRAMRVERIACG